MRSVTRSIAIILVLLAGWAAPPRLAQAANLDTTADRVIGQPDFSSAVINSGGLSAASLYYPEGAVLDAQGNLYVADEANNRVLVYDAPLTLHAAASRVIGQPNVFTNTVNNGGAVSAASLYRPVGVALDAQGNLYVADAENNRVLEYDAPLTTGMAANRVFGQGGSFTTATANKGGLSASSLDGPWGVALDAQGNLYVPDRRNYRVLEYDAPLASGAAASRVLGQGSSFTSAIPNNGGLGAASLNYPEGVALDAQGNLYVADWGNHRVLEYDAPVATGAAANRVFGQGGVFNTGSPNKGGLTAASLNAPIGVALDVQGNLYVADTNNNRVLEYDAPLTTDTTADRVFGQGGSFNTGSANNGGGPTADSLSGPWGVALDTRGNLYVGDTSNHRLLEYDVPVPYGVPVLSALSPSSVAAGSPSFTLTVNGSGFVAGSVVRWNGSNRPTTYLSSLQLNASISAGDVAAGGPFAVTVFTPLPGGGTSSLINLSLYARAGQDTTADAVQGQPSFADNTINNPLLPSGANRLYSPNGVAVASQSGRLFVADSSNNRVLSWSNAPAFANGQPADLVLGQPDFRTTDSNHGGLGPQSMSYPSAAAVDALGNLYVADSGNNRVLEFNAPLSTHLAASRVFGQGGSFTTALPNNGGVSANSLNGPFGVGLDKQGHLYVADSSNNRVLEYDTPLSGVTTANQVFGQPDPASNSVNNGGLTAASLDSPFGVAADVQGNLYVADYSNNRVLEYDAPLTTDRIADRVFGQPDVFTNTVNNGGVSATSLSSPIGLALDGWGRLYVADAGNSRVLEYDAPLTAAAAARAFGQPDLFSAGINTGGVSATSLAGAWGVALDGQGNLYVADTGNSRLLEYDWALAKIYLPLVRH